MVSRSLAAGYPAEEIEIARVSLQSTTRDVISVRAHATRSSQPFRFCSSNCVQSTTAGQSAHHVSRIAGLWNGKSHQE